MEWSMSPWAALLFPLTFTDHLGDARTGGQLGNSVDDQDHAAGQTKDPGGALRCLERPEECHREKNHGHGGQNRCDNLGPREAIIWSSQKAARGACSNTGQCGLCRGRILV